MPLNIEAIKKDLPVVIDLTDTLNLIVNIEKTKALKLLSKFDIEWSEDRKLVKHYPLDDIYPSSDYEAQAKKLENLSHAFWLTFNHYVEKVLPQEVPVLMSEVLEACEWGERPEKVKKLGKIYTCQPARFGTVGKPVETVKPFLYAYKTDYGTELMGEINFGIEIY